MFYHDQDQAVDRPRNLSIVALILMDTTLVPDVPKPLEEDMQDAKLLYYYSPEQASVHTIRYQVGLSEGLLLFFGEYADKIPKNVETELDDHRFAVETIEENLLMCVLIEEHGDKTDAIRDEGLALIQVLHKHWKLFYGTFNSWRNANDKRLNENFKSVMDHFVAQFIRFSSIDEQESLINIQRLQPSGLERFGLQRAQFLLTSQIESILEESEVGADKWVLFYKNFYIYGNLDYDDASTLKSYFFGLGRHPNHLTYADKYSDFRKCTLDNREGMQQCRYGLVNQAKETKNVLMGVLGEEKGSEKFMPYVYFPKKECFEIVRSPQKSEEMKFDLLSLEIKPDNEQGKPVSEADNNVEDGLVKYKMCLFKVGNFMLPILTKPNNTKIEEQFNTIKNQLKSVLEHCEKMILNQLSLVESSLQKKSNILSSIIYNEVNRSVVYYPFSKFSLANLPAPMIHLATRLFTTGIDQPSITEIECQLDGYHFALTKWNQRTILVISEDKKMLSKDFHNHLATFRTGLTDIFI